MKLPKFKEIEDAEDFISLWFNRLLWVIVIGLGAIWLPVLLQLSEPNWWLIFEKMVGVSW